MEIRQIFQDKFMNILKLVQTIKPGIHSLVWYRSIMPFVSMSNLISRVFRRSETICFFFRGRETQKNRFCLRSVFFGIYHF